MWMEELMGVEQSQTQSESLVEEANGGVETTTYHDNDKENANITKVRFVSRLSKKFFFFLFFFPFIYYDIIIIIFLNLTLKSFVV